MWKKEKGKSFSEGNKLILFLMWKKEEIDESGYVIEPSYFLLFSVSCLTTSQQRRVRGLVFEDNRCAADVIKVS